MSAKAMQSIAKGIKKMLPNDFGFTLLVYKYGESSTANYISSANRNDMIEMLRETANRLEKKQDFDTPENNIY